MFVNVFNKATILHLWFLFITYGVLLFLLLYKVISHFKTNTSKQTVYRRERNQKNNIPDHPYRTLIVNGSGSRKTNALLNLINHESDIFICKRSI